MSSSGQTYWTPRRVACWVLVTVAVSVVMGPKFVRNFRPANDYLQDFLQEWLSAKNYWEGIPVYAEQRETLKKHTDRVPSPGGIPFLEWNAHPPTSVLITLPFGFLGYEDAQLAWNLLMVPLLVLAVGLVLRELGARFYPWSILPAVTLTLLCHPLSLQIGMGQWNIVLLLLLVLTWVADRRGYQVGAGTALGLAAALKVFPAFLFLYFVLTGRWRAVWSGFVAAAVVTGVTLAVLGTDAFRTYFRDVLPGLQIYRSWWPNVSLSAFWLRLFDPLPSDRVIPVAALPGLGRGLAVLSQLLVVGVVSYTAWRARDTAEKDRAFALAIVGVLLISPIAWTHYFLMLLIPLGLLWWRLPSGWLRRVFWVLLVAFWVPMQFFLTLAIGPARAAAILSSEQDLISPRAILIISGHTYALVALFALLAAAPLRRPEEAAESDPREVSDSTDKMYPQPEK